MAGREDGVPRVVLFKERYDIMSRTFSLEDAVPRGMVFAGTRDKDNANNQLVQLHESLKREAFSAGANCVFGVEIQLNSVGNAYSSVVGHIVGDAYKVSQTTLNKLLGEE